MAAPLSSGIKNWHWRTKGLTAWSKTYWEQNLVGVEANGVRIDEVTDVEGDAELGMRKSKLVTIYDERVSCRWKATTTSGDEVTGTLTCPEVMHDMDEDEYVFEASISSGSGSEAEAFLSTAKKALANKLRPKFQQFPKDMIAHHGKDLLSDDADSAPGSGASTPAPSTSTTPAPSSSAAAAKPATKPFATVNTATVRATGEFQCDAESLFDFLTNKDKVPAWSRNPAQIEPKEGAEVVMFGGNIRGKIQKVDRPKLVTMSWRAPTWPEDHYGTLEMALEQGSNSTTLNLKLSGVPIGKEDETESNLRGFYIIGLNSIGLGLLSSSSSSATVSTSTSSPSAKRRTPRAPPPQRGSVVNRWTLANVGTFAASFGLIVAMGAALYYGPSGPGGKK
ncbi:hypothetical protein JCM10207_007402 [Rhodosporidiobolus poonsookiae]